MPQLACKFEWAMVIILTMNTLSQLNEHAISPAESETTTGGTVCDVSCYCDSTHCVRTTSYSCGHQDVETTSDCMGDM